MDKKLKAAVDRILADDMPRYSFGSETIALCNDFEPDEILAALPESDREFIETHWAKRIGDGTDLVWAPDASVSHEAVQKIVAWNKRRKP